MWVIIISRFFLSSFSLIFSFFHDMFILIFHRISNHVPIRGAAFSIFVSCIFFASSFFFFLSCGSIWRFSVTHHYQKTSEGKPWSLQRRQVLFLFWHLFTFYLLFFWSFTHARCMACSTHGGCGFRALVLSDFLLFIFYSKHPFFATGCDLLCYTFGDTLCLHFLCLAWVIFACVLLVRYGIRLSGHRDRMTSICGSHQGKMVALSNMHSGGCIHTEGTIVYL